MNTRFEQFVGKGVYVSCVGEDNYTGTLRETNNYGILLEVTGEKKLFFFPWNVIHQIDLSEAYGQIGKAA